MKRKPKRWLSFASSGPTYTAATNSITVHIVVTAPPSAVYLPKRKKKGA